MPLTLPYPPSVNHYWRRVGLRTLISREGRTLKGKGTYGWGNTPKEARSCLTKRLKDTNAG